MAVVMSISIPHMASAKGSWTCGYEDIAGIEQAEAVREATLSQKFYVTDDGRVEVVEIVVEERNTPFWVAIVEGIRDKLGLGADERVAKSLAARTDATRPKLNTELHNWSLSPLKRVRLDQPEC